MEWTSDAIRQTTAVTDFMLGGASLACVLSLLPARKLAPFKVTVWMLALALMGVAAVIGGVRFGLVLPESTSAALKIPFNLCLGLTVSLFAVGVIVDRFAEALARKLAPVLVLAGLGFFAITQVVPGSFLIFLAYEALALLFALGAYLSLLRSPLRGAGWMAAGIGLSIAAAAVQATKALSFSLGTLAFDANGVFHLMQTAAVVMIAWGLRQGLTTSPGVNGSAPTELGSVH